MFNRLCQAFPHDDCFNLDTPYWCPFIRGFEILSVFHKTLKETVDEIQSGIDNQKALHLKQVRKEKQRELQRAANLKKEQVKLKKTKPTRRFKDGWDVEIWSEMKKRKVSILSKRRKRLAKEGKKPLEKWKTEKNEQKKQK